MHGEDVHAYFKREYMCITTVGITPGWGTNATQNGTDLLERPETLPADACWGEFVNRSSEHNVIYLGNDTACLLNLPTDLRIAMLQRMIDEFTDNPINCHVQFAYDDTTSNVLSFGLLCLLFVSMFCLVLTIVVYAVKGELHSIPGLNLTCLCLSHLAHYLTGVINLFNHPHYMVSNEACTFFGFSRNFSILATFFWLNVMAFDIWRTVGSMNVSVPFGKSGRIFKWKRFLKYACYAWGMSLFIALWAVVFDSIPNMPESWRPGYSRPYLMNPDLRCAMSGNNLGSLLLFNTLPRLVVLLVNCVFFFLTARTIHQVSSGVAETMKITNNQRNRFRLYIKLYIVMGLAWTLNIIDYIIHLHYGIDWVWSGPHWFNKIADYVTSLIGVAIFATFALVPMLGCFREKCCPLASVERPLFRIPRTNSIRTSAATLTRFIRSKKQSSLSSATP